MSSPSDPPPFLDSPAAFHEFLATWEAGALPKAAWTHAAHVAVGAAYSVRYGPGAVDELRRGIKRHNEAVGTTSTGAVGYHETLTCFWAGVLSRVVSGLVDPWLAACHAVKLLGDDRNLHRQYYSFDVVKHPDARVTFVPPDLAGPY
jgi:hypothetical protein